MNVLPMWVVYRDPSDFPGKWVARQWEINADGVDPTGEIVVARSHEALVARLNAIADGMTRLPRQHDDDPVIVETWM